MASTILLAGVVVAIGLAVVGGGAVVAVQLGATPPTSAIESPEATSGLTAVAPEPSASTTPEPRVGRARYLVQAGDDLFTVWNATGIDTKLLRYWNVERYPSLARSPQLEPGWILSLKGPPLPTAEPRPTPTPGSVAGRAPGSGSGGGAGDAGSGLVPLPALTVDVWNAGEEYFAISGTNPNELIASAETNIPPKCLEWSGEAMACAGPSTQSVDPTYTVNQTTGACTMTGATVTVTYTATLPQWTSPPAVPSELLAWWQTVLEHIRWHEEQHVRIFTEQFGRLPTLLTGHPCSEAEAVLDRWTSEMIAAQEAFHAVDANWRPPPYSGR